MLQFGGGPQTLPGLGGFKVALGAMDGLRHQWAGELGQHGLRVITLKTDGIPASITDSKPMKETMARNADTKRYRPGHREEQSARPRGDPRRYGQCRGLCGLGPCPHAHVHRGEHRRAMLEQPALLGPA
jgi:hypothetical protein